MSNVRFVISDLMLVENEYNVDIVSIKKKSILKIKISILKNGFCLPRSKNFWVCFHIRLFIYNIVNKVKKNLQVIFRILKEGYLKIKNRSFGK